MNCKEYLAQLHDKLNLKIYEVSAKLDTNINTIFEVLI